MFFSEDEIVTDAEEEAFEESLKGLNISFAVPDPDDSAHEAAEWVASPDVMLVALTAELNEVLSLCEARLYDGVLIQVKPDFMDNAQMDLTLRAFSLGDRAKFVDLVNSIQPTPFQSQKLRRMQSLMFSGNTPEFDRAISDYKAELRKLALWIKAKEILSGEVKSDDASPAQQRKSANIDDVKRAYEQLIESGEKPTKERIIQVIRDLNLKLGSDRAQAMKRQVEKQSAVRPPETAD